MAEAAARRRWTKAEFFAWLDEGHGGDYRWELVDGEPKAITYGDPLEMMANPSVEHGIVTGNIFARLMERLRGGPCRPFGGDYATETLDDQLRLPDVLVDCGERQLGERVATGPTVVFEVLSPSTRGTDTFAKLEEYKRVDTISHIVIVEPLMPDIAVWTRDGVDWSYARITDAGAALRLPAIGVELPLDEVYEDVPDGGAAPGR